MKKVELNQYDIKTVLKQLYRLAKIDQLCWSEDTIISETESYRVGLGLAMKAGLEKYYRSLRETNDVSG